MEKKINTRNREFENCKNQNQIYKQQTNLLNSQYKEKFSIQNISQMEESIYYTQNDNIKLSKRIMNMKKFNKTKNKEIELYSKQKYYPYIISNLTVELHKLLSKKHDIHR